MQFLKFILSILEILLFAYLAFGVFYILLFSIAGLFKAKSKTISVTKAERKFAVLIPGYKEDAVIVEVAKRALEQTYDRAKFDVVVIADSFEKETLNALRALPIILIEVSFETSTKSKALNAAMAQIGDSYDVALILDADNIMEPDFVHKMNSAFDKGYKVVQGHRMAKNTNTPFAILDAISEEVNNHIFRKGHRVLGFSSALIGSGMAFDYQFFKSTMANIKAIGGFDKELELTLLRDGETIEYLHDALVLDEKVQKADVFANQRKRWLSAQFVYFQRFFWSGIKALVLKGNIDFFDKVYQMIAPPRVLLAGLVTVFAVTTVLFQVFFPEISMLFSVPPFAWQVTFGAVVVAFLCAVPRVFYNGKTLNALLTLPKAFALMFLSLFKLKGANKKFIHTQHGTINS
ncbi:glycosyltransferase [Maribacter chungangensis]|uniref:Glycosyltransferase n=1 Tax=Maribacter chungangensis TaxID=1069117 RepID=A0ABW3B6B4_9FLAO